MMRSDRTEAGFTLIELIVVISIMSVLLMIATPAVRQYQLNASYREAARMVANFLQEGRNQAIAEGIAYTVGCNPTASACTVSRVVYDIGSHQFVLGDPPTASYDFNKAVRMKTGTGGACDQDTAIEVQYLPNGSAEINPAGAFEVCVMTTDGDKRFIVKLESEATGKVSIGRP